MLRTIKPRNARSKRALEKREPKLVEDAKGALFIPGMTCGAIVSAAMTDLYLLKKPDAKKLSKKNDIRPFEDASSLEFLSEKNDAPLLVFGQNSKKRPQSLTFIRTFDYKIYDMIELHVESQKFLSEFRKETFQVGAVPILVFSGAIFDSNPIYRHIKSLFTDFYAPRNISKLDLAGLKHVIAISAKEMEKDTEKLPTINFRVYTISTLRSGQKAPRVELTEVGPRFNLRVGRHEEAPEELVKEASRQPKQLEPKTKKNVSTDIIGDKVGQIHVGKQDLNKLQTRKMKGLKRKSFDIEDGEIPKRVRA